MGHDPSTRDCRITSWVILVDAINRSILLTEIAHVVIRPVNMYGVNLNISYHLEMMETGAIEARQLTFSLGNSQGVRLHS